MEAVLTGSRAVLLGLIEILKRAMALLTKANTIITVEGSRLQPGDVLDASQPTCVRHQPYTQVSVDRVKPDEQMNNRQEPPTEASPDLFIVKGHMTNACAVL